MTRSRTSLVSINDTPYYHCIGRCVRQYFLCGTDPVSGKSFDHRKQTILERLALLSEVFAIDLCAYALMSNHYHLVLRLAPNRAEAWSAREVVERWRRIYVGPPCASRYLDGKPLGSEEQTLLDDCISRWRVRLADLSWFMRCLNEYIARVANAEEGRTGRFWEGRFKSQALLDDTALLTAMTYVDLNPVRAGTADSVESSLFTSVRQRVQDAQQDHPKSRRSGPTLLPFADAAYGEGLAGLPFNLLDYLELVDSTGRIVHPTKPGHIASAMPRLLAGLGIAPAEWGRCVVGLRASFHHFVGAPHRLSALASRRGWRWIRGQTAARRLYAHANE